MILSSLVDYYEILSKAGEIPGIGYSKANVSYALSLSKEGELIGVISLKETRQRGKKMVEVPKLLQVPEQEKRASGVKSNFLCENSSYILGIDNKSKPERSKECFDAFKELHHKILDGVDSEAANAVLTFLDSWEIDKVYENEVLKDYIEELIQGSNIVFSIYGDYAHEDTEVRKAWETYKSSKEDSVKMQCLITGKASSIARLHPSIKGVRGAQSSGASIVSFNAKAYESYGHDGQQGLNAPVSEYAAFAYSTVLNQLLSSVGNRQVYGDTTIVYWAKTTEPIYSQIFAYSMNPENQSKDEEIQSERMEKTIGSAFKYIMEGKPVDEFNIDKETRFYILGLSPNAARISVRFFIENSFGNILKNITRHYKDLEIEKSPKEFEYLPLWKLMSETVSPKSRDKASSPLLSGAVLRSIIEGTKYPEALFCNVIVRIRAEREINRGKAAIIKACLIRKYRNEKYKEELTVALNEESTNKAYILGRLFAVLEKAQQDANPGINSTIKDRYFTSACATPATVFPNLLKLSMHHISKAKYGTTSEKRISELMQKLDVNGNPFPAHLKLDDQGIFILGYYHQQKALYKKNDEEDK